MNRRTSKSRSSQYHSQTTNATAVNNPKAKSITTVSEYQPNLCPFDRPLKEAIRVIESSAKPIISKRGSGPELSRFGNIKLPRIAVTTAIGNAT